MKEFDELLSVTKSLMGPNGCPWDKEQTMESLIPFFLEEVHELIEAIHAGETKTIQEEAGDLFYSIIFLGEIAKKNKQFTVADIMGSIAKKLIYRHPHVFSDESLKDAEAVMVRWEQLKKKEKGKDKRKSIYDGMPTDLPILLKLQKLLKKAKRINTPFAQKIDKNKKISEEKFIETFFNLVIEAENSNINVETAVRKKTAWFENFLKKEEPEINS